MGSKFSSGFTVGPSCESGSEMGDPSFPSSGTPPYLKALKGELPMQQWGFAQNYKKFFDTGSVRPLFHICIFVGVVGYTLDYWRHLRFERHSVKAKQLLSDDPHH